MTNLDHVISLVGSKSELARIIGRHPAIVSRMVPEGRIPWHFNKPLLQWAEGRGVSDELKPYLEWTCPHCGRGVDSGAKAE